MGTRGRSERDTRTREKSLRGMESVGYSEQGWCSEKEGAGKKEAQLRSGPASRSRPISSWGLGSELQVELGILGRGPQCRVLPPALSQQRKGGSGEGPPSRRCGQRRGGTHQ